MSAATVEFVMYRGETVTFPMVHRTSKDDPTPQDITGFTILMTVRNADGTTAFTVAGSITNAAKGQYTLTVTGGAAGQSDIASGKRDSDVQRTNAGSERVMAIGPFVILPDVKFGS